MLLFPEPTKNQRPRSTARFLVESEGGVKRKNATILSTSHSHSDGVDLSSRQAQSPCVGTSQTPGFPKMPGIQALLTWLRSVRKGELCHGIRTPDFHFRRRIGPHPRLRPPPV